MRYKGFLKALADANLTFDKRLQLVAETSEEEVYKATLALLQKRISFDAIFGASDLIAVGGIKALEEADLAVPTDVAVMGFDDIPMASYTNPPLTTVQQNTRLAGEPLVENLLKLVNGEEAMSMLLPAQLVVRGSCGFPASIARI